MRNPPTEKRVPCRRIFYRNEDKRKAIFFLSFVLTLLIAQSVAIGILSSTVWRLTKELTSDSPLVYPTHEPRQDNQ